MLGETLTGISKDMDLTSFRTPIGVCAGIAPFNFPAMIPLWMFPMATICGNTYIMKPSERDPTACMALLELLKDAGMPDGVVNVIHGQHDTVNFICDQPDIRAISFVGGDAAGRHIYQRQRSKWDFQEKYLANLARGWHSMFALNRHVLTLYKSGK